MFAAFSTAIRNALLSGTILAAAPLDVARTDQASPTVALPAPGPARLRMIADTSNCAATPVGEIVVATLDNTPIVTFSANNHPVTLLLDTGAERTVFIPSVAERIGAQPPRVEFQRQIRGIAGTLPSREVELSQFAAGHVAIPWRRVVVAPVTMAKIFPTPLDGLLGADVLSSFDIDLDLPHQRMELYDKRSCLSGPPWAGPYSEITTGRSRGEHLFFPAQLDGRRFEALVDTGAQLTTLSLTAALALGVNAATLALDRSIATRGATIELLNSHVHRFSQLKVGAEVVSNPDLVVADVTLGDADIVLGVDFLRSRRIWLSYESLQIFLSSARE